MTRVTHQMLGQRSLAGLQGSLTRLAQIQEHLSTGRVINRPSDDPAGATSAMQVRSSLASERQYLRNAADGLGWLGQIDGALDTMSSQVIRARDLALQGGTGSTGQQARLALAAEVTQLRDGVIAAANTTYLDRPVFGGLTDGMVAYDPATGAYQPTTFGLGEVTRTVGDGVTVRVDVEGPTVLGPDGDSVMDHLAGLATALTSGDQAAIKVAIDRLNADADRIHNVRAEVGTRVQRIEWAQTQSTDKEISLRSSLSEIENADLAKTVVELQLQEVAYQAALSATGRVIQPSLLEFLR